MKRCFKMKALNPIKSITSKPNFFKLHSFRNRLSFHQNLKFPFFFIVLTSSAILPYCKMIGPEEESSDLESALDHYQSKEYQKAKELLEKLVENGNTTAMLHLSEMYLLGKGMKR